MYIKERYYVVILNYPLMKIIKQTQSITNNMYIKEMVKEMFSYLNISNVCSKESSFNIYHRNIRYKGIPEITITIVDKKIAKRALIAYTI
jgi:uncharacterized protein YpiB (UPF0302 family)